MNPVGAKIWEMLKMNHPVDRVADILANEFSVPREQVLEDVRAFLAQLETPTRENSTQLILASLKQRPALFRMRRRQNKFLERNLRTSQA
jgi:hypothetical protein